MPLLMAAVWCESISRLVFANYFLFLLLLYHLGSNMEGFNPFH